MDKIIGAVSFSIRNFPKNSYYAFEFFLLLGQQWT